MSRLTFFPLIFLVLITGLASISFYFYQKTHFYGSGQSRDEAQQLTETIEQFFLLPQDAIPMIATVTDIEKLAGNPFFRQAENGDKVLVYQEEQLVLLYRPSIQKLITVATTSVESEKSFLVQSGTVQGQSDVATVHERKKENITSNALSQPIIHVALLNGTTKTGLTNEFERDVVAGDPAIEIVTSQTAVHQDYERTIIIDITGRFSEQAHNIADDIGTSVESLPDGEVIPEGTDILVIVGADRV